MRWIAAGKASVLASLLLCGCSEKQPDAPTSSSAIQSASFAIVETELSPAILVHSRSKYLEMFGNPEAPSHLAFATRSGPRSFKRGDKLSAEELEQCWLVLWDTNVPPWVVYLQHKPRALAFDTNGLHLSFTNAAGDVVLLPLHGSSTKVDTKKWPEFLTRAPLLRIRYWASVLREFPLECETTMQGSNTVTQRFRFHSIRDDWNTKPLKLAPMSPPLTPAVDEKVRRKLLDLKMPTPFGPYMGLEGVSEWTADFPSQVRFSTNCAWVSIGDCSVASPHTTLLGNDRPHVAPTRDKAPAHIKETLLNPSTRLLAYD